MSCDSDALQDLGLGSRILSSDDRIAQLLSNRNEIEGRAGTRHGNARDSHGVETEMAFLFAFGVVELKCSNSLYNHLRFCIGCVGKSFILGNHKEN